MSESEPVEPVDPRFTLANERTYLAWGRMSLALIAAGLAVTELLPQLGAVGSRRMLGVPMMLSGGLIAALADIRRRHVQTELEAGRGVPESRMPDLLTAMVIVISITAALMVTLG